MAVARGDLNRGADSYDAHWGALIYPVIAIAQLTEIVAAPTLDFTAAQNGACMASPGCYLCHVRQTGNQHGREPTGESAIADLPVVVVAPAFNLAAHNERAGVHAADSYLRDITQTRDSYRGISVDGCAIAQLTEIVVPPALNGATSDERTGVGFPALNLDGAR